MHISINLITTMNATIDLSHRIFKDIDSNYALVNIDGKKMVMMKSNGYINISNISNESDFVSANNGKAICEILEKKYGVKECIIKSLSGSPPFKGTYVHPCLAVHLLRVEAAKRSVVIATAILNECVEDKVVEEDSDAVLMIIRSGEDKKSSPWYTAIMCHRDDQGFMLKQHKTENLGMKLLRSFYYDNDKIRDIRDKCFYDNYHIGCCFCDEDMTFAFEIAKGYSEKKLITSIKVILANISLKDD